MDISPYLKRIDYRGPTQPTVETLQSLHRAHLLAVPFENLDIQLNRRIVLNEAALYEKIVIQKRGGFCYELNGLFAGLLRQLGFRVTMFSANVLHGGIPQELTIFQSSWSWTNGRSWMWALATLLACPFVWRLSVSSSGWVRCIG